MVASPCDYRWSSYRHNCGEEHLDWLEAHAEFQALGSNLAARVSTYRKLVGEGLSREISETIRTSLKRNQVTGNSRFRKRLEKRLGRRVSQAGPGRPRKQT